MQHFGVEPVYRAAPAAGVAGDAEKLWLVTLGNLNAAPSVALRILDRRWGFVGAQATSSVSSHRDGISKLWLFSQNDEELTTRAKDRKTRHEASTAISPILASRINRSNE